MELSGFDHIVFLSVSRYFCRIVDIFEKSLIYFHLLESCENNKGHPSKRAPSFYFVNCASSVDPFNAVVDEVPPVITCATSSK